MNFIVAVDKNWGIGKDNKLLFHISADMKFFKETTMGGKVIMGDKTFFSLPGPAPLKGRENIVMSLDNEFKTDGVVVCHSVNELSRLLGDDNTDNVFVIGGATIYNMMMDCCEYAYITKVDAIKDADVFIKNLDEKENWQIVNKGEIQENNDLKFRFMKYKNNKIKSLEEI